MKKLIRLFFFIMLGVCVVIIGINIYVCSIGNKGFTTVDDVEGTYDCAIVPGALVWGNVPCYMLQDRLDFALKLYQDQKVKKILVSGDHGKDYYDEVNTMKSYLMNQGVKEEDIFMDHAGFDTYSTMVRAKKIFQVESCIITTQKYHLYRAIYLAKKQGLDVKGIPSDVYISRRLPYYKLREAAARIKAVLYAEILKPDPLLGVEIPIDGDGRMTEDGLT